MEWDVVQKALELEFHEEEAERQLDTAIDWGRYAELWPMTTAARSSSWSRGALWGLPGRISTFPGRDSG